MPETRKRPLYFFHEVETPSSAILENALDHVLKDEDFDLFCDESKILYFFMI